MSFYMLLAEGIAQIRVRFSPSQKDWIKGVSSYLKDLDQNLISLKIKQKFVTGVPYIFQI